MKGGSGMYILWKSFGYFVLIATANGRNLKNEQVWFPSATLRL